MLKELTEPKINAEELNEKVAKIVEELRESYTINGMDEFINERDYIGMNAFNDVMNDIVENIFNHKFQPMHILCKTEILVITTIEKYL